MLEAGPGPAAEDRLSSWLHCIERGAFLDGGFPGAWAELKDNASLSTRKNTLRTFITFLPGLHVSSVRIHCQNETLKGEQTRIPMSHLSATESSLYLGYFLQTSLIIIKETSVTFLKGYERITLNQSPAIQKSPPSSPIFVKGCKYLPHFHFINHPVTSCPWTLKVPSLWTVLVYTMNSY